MKISDKTKKQAIKLAEQHGFSRIWVNDLGEFFSLECNASNSVKQDKERYSEVLLGVAPSENYTTDFETAKEVIEHIESVEIEKEVADILKAEKEGKSRKTVIEAAEKKLLSLAKEEFDLIDSLTTSEELDLYIEVEKEGKNRSYILDACEKGLEKLKAGGEE